MQQIDLTKRSQAERLVIANSLIASVWEEYLNGTVDRSTIQVAAYIQANANRIVWKLNALNNPNTLEALDCISRQDATAALRDEFERIPTIAIRATHRIKRLPPAQPETYKEKLNEIASALSEKFAYMNTCPNERDIILGYLGVNRRCNTHCNTDCTNTKCESHPLSSAQPSTDYIYEELSKIYNISGMPKDAIDLIGSLMLSLDESKG